MGLLKKGDILSWSRAKDIQDLIKDVSLQEIIRIYHCYTDLHNTSEFTWGYEIEYMLYKNWIKEYRFHFAISKNAHNILSTESDHLSWHPEYLSAMIENVPDHPLKWTDLDNIQDILEAYKNNLVNQHSTLPISCSTHFILGNEDICSHQSIGGSTLLDNSYIYPHDRFYHLTKNIVDRRGKPIQITLPVFKDSNTKINYIELDAMGFGMGCCCLQSTYSMQNLDEAKYIYDQLTVLSPLLLAISASTPISNGHILDTDTRISVLEQSVDCRQEKECDKVNYSRYYWNQLYIGEDCEIFNDIDVYLVEDHLKKLVDQGIPVSFAKYIASLHVHDCLLIYKDQCDQSNKTLGEELKGEMFTNILSSNWTNVRLKPPLDTKSWKVELRCLDIQRNSYENSAFLIFVTVLVKTLMYFRIDFRIPMSHLHINIKKAQEVNALEKNLFYYSVDDQVHHGKIKDIFIGNRDRKGILDYMQTYLVLTKASTKVCNSIDSIVRKIKGQTKTNAQLIRDYIFQHPEYTHESIITERIACDLLHDLFVV